MLCAREPCRHSKVVWYNNPNTRFPSQVLEVAADLQQVSGSGTPRIKKEAVTQQLDAREPQHEGTPDTT